MDERSMGGPPKKPEFTREEWRRFYAEKIKRDNRKRAEAIREYTHSVQEAEEFEKYLNYRNPEADEAINYYHLALFELLEGIRNFIIDYIDDPQFNEFILERLEMIKVEDLSLSDEVAMELENLDKHGVIREHTVEILCVIKSILLIPTDNDPELDELRKQFSMEVGKLYKRLGKAVPRGFDFMTSRADKNNILKSSFPLDNFFLRGNKVHKDLMTEQLDALLVEYPKPGELFDLLMEINQTRDETS